MKNTLEQYVDQHNSWNKIFDQNHVDVDINTMTKTQGDMLISKLDSEMSPENLHCDGEISHAQAQQKFDYYTGVFEDLKDVYNQQGWDLPEVWELTY